MDLNINQTVSFVLTNRGAEILTLDNDFMASLTRTQPKKFVAGQTHSMQLWSFMALFGPHMNCTSEPPCKNCVITILP